MENYSALQAELSSTLFHLSSSIQAFSDTLTSIPQHPYDATKAMYFPVDYKFPTVYDVNVPEDVCLNTIIKGFDTVHHRYQEKILDYLSCPNEYDLTDAGNQFTILAEHLGENKYIVTEDKYRMYLEALELIQGIDITSVNEDNCVELIHKICFTVLQALQKKTI